MKLNKKIVAGTSIALAIVGLWLVFRKPKQPKTSYEPNPNIPSPPPPPPPPPPPSRNDNFPLKKGSYGARVKELQLILLKFDSTILPKFGVDGDFGTETEIALMKVSAKKTVDSQSELDSLKYRKSGIFY